MNKNKQLKITNSNYIPPLYCHSDKCGVFIANKVKVNNKIYLDINDWLVESAKKHCPKCGRFISWKQPKKEVPKLEFNP